MSKQRQIIGLIAWLAFSFAAAVTGVFVSTGQWYDEITKPHWHPPSWIFGPVWSTLYVMMGIAVWLIWRQGGWNAQLKPIVSFVLQWLLNALWTPLFFGLHRMDWALIEIGLLWIAIVVTIVLFYSRNRWAAALLIPYLVWVSFAAFLNLTLWRMN